MKRRNGFVANSSSSSFLVYAQFLSAEQREELIRYEREWTEYCGDETDNLQLPMDNPFALSGYSLNCSTLPDGTAIFEGSTSMDNGEFWEWLEAHGYPLYHFHREDQN